MLLSQEIRRVAITGRTDRIRTGLLGRQGGQWTQQWVEGAFPGAAARTHGTPPPADRAASLQTLEQLRSRGLLSDEEVARLRRSRGL
jgi:hypothetical protein